MRVVVLGTGSIGMRHLGVLQGLPDVQPLAVPTRPERLAELQARGIPAVATLDEALAMSPAGVVVATATGRHAQDAVACLRVCPVLVEKPLAGSREDAERVVAAARAHGRALHVACCLRFDAGLAWAHHRLDALGPPHLLDIECLSWLPSWRPQRELLSSYSARAGEGGVLLDLIHEIDSCLWFGGPLASLQAQLENRGLLGLPSEVEETALLVGRHGSGLASTVRLSYAVRPPTRRLRIWGAAGMVEWDGINRLARRCDGDGVELETFAWSGPQGMYVAQMETWLRSLRGGAPDRLVDGAWGAYEVAVCDAARRSSAQGRQENLS